MTISAEKGKPFSMFFVTFNSVSFFIYKMVLLNNIIVHMSVILVYLLIVLLGVVTSLMYSVINIHFTHRIQDKVIDGSKYIRSCDCRIFSGYSSPYILKLKKDICSIYINETYLSSIHDRRDIFELRTRFFMLNLFDMLYIYLYKYVSTICFSILLFIIWQICSNLSINISIVINIVLVIAVIIVYFFINKIILNIITKIMKKRNLQKFMI